MDKDKPTPEVLARAGFFYHSEPPYLPDNVVCPFCRIYLDKWEAHDDPMSEHEQRSPSCPFIRGPTPVRKINREATVRPTQAQLGSNGKSPDDRKPPSHQEPEDNQEPQHDDKPHGNDPRQDEPFKERTVAVAQAKAKGLAWRIGARNEVKKSYDEADDYAPQAPAASKKRRKMDTVTGPPPPAATPAGKRKRGSDDTSDSKPPAATAREEEGSKPKRQACHNQDQNRIRNQNEQHQAGLSGHEEYATGHGGVITLSKR
ncbi:hypothetical protein VPNG_06151 [Cytospora leucostoma]|uniref:BIR-domain-containing protein n=1 Tax=Cytospora leucostoma TaxID=1230097 RepID=A0A423WYM4_9PEZI|nr:hypothetical protein VPNG_06151 [Cytospora leucostoma]